MSLIKCDSSVVQLVKPSTAKCHKSIETTMKAAENHSIVDAATLLRCAALGDAPDDARWLQAGASLAVRPPATLPPLPTSTHAGQTAIYIKLIVGSSTLPNAEQQTALIPGQRCGGSVR